MAELIAYQAGTDPGYIRKPKKSDFMRQTYRTEAAGRSGVRRVAGPTVLDEKAYSAAVSEWNTYAKTGKPSLAALQNPKLTGRSAGGLDPAASFDYFDAIYKNYGMEGVNKTLNTTITSNEYRPGLSGPSVTRPYSHLMARQVNGKLELARRPDEGPSGVAKALHGTVGKAAGWVGSAASKVLKPTATAFDQTVGQVGRELHRGLNNYLDEAAYVAGAILAWPAIAYAGAQLAGGVGASGGGTGAAQAQLASSAAAQTGTAAGGLTTGAGAQTTVGAIGTTTGTTAAGTTAGTAAATKAATTAFAEYAGTAAGTQQATQTATTAAKAMKVAKTAGKVVSAVNAGSQAIGYAKSAESIDELRAQLDANEAALRAEMAAEGVAIPTPSDEAIRNARKRSLAMQKSRRGRSASILSDPGRQPLG